MGVSTDAILCYGVDFGEEPDGLPFYDEENGVDFDEWVYSLTPGLSNTHLWDTYYEWEKTPEAQALRATTYNLVPEFEKLNPQWRDELNEIYARRREAENNAPVELVYHCSGDYPMYIVAVKGTTVKAWRGEPQEITTETFEIDVKHLFAAQRFCEEHEIPFEDPTWILCSYYSH